MLRALSRHRSRLASISIALLSLFLIPGCIIVVGGRGHHDWDWDSEFQYDERLVERFTFDIESGTPVTIATENGSVSVTRSDEVSHATVVAHFDSFSRKRLEDSTVVMTTLEDGSVEIAPAWAEANRRRGETCDLEVIMPDTSSLVVRSGNGRIEVSGFSGVVDIETQDGRIKALDMGGPVFATTHDGRIVLSQVPGTMAPVSLFSHDGSIKAELAATFEGSLDIDTRDGHVSIVNADSLVAESSVSNLTSEHITMSVGTAPDESVISTRDGSISVSFQK